MVFTAKSPKINIEEVRALSKLEGQALGEKITARSRARSHYTWRRPADSLGNRAMLI